MSEYALITHSRARRAEVSARWIEGRAMFTMVASSTTISCATAITPRARLKLRGSGGDVLSV